MAFQRRKQWAFIIFWWTQVIVTYSAPNKSYLASPGTPLSDEEYEQFIKLIQPELKAKELCEIRLASGCEDPQVMGFDLIENHGQIPKGLVCTELDMYPQFNSFCQFALFRCTENQFYVKRIPCSEQIQDIFNLAEDAITPQVFPYSSASRVINGQHVFDKTAVEQFSSSLHSLTHNLLLFSFKVCGQQPIRRNQTNPPKSTGASMDPSRMKKLEVSNYDKGQETDLAQLDLKPEKKYKAAMTVHVKKQKNPAVSNQHRERKDTIGKKRSAGPWYPRNTSNIARNKGKTRETNTTTSSNLTGVTDV